ncbi:membrane protein [Leucobacter sp. UCD-THU]|nr:DUF6112 family protein [Leucobacter sp. UCD-THU]EYT56580.1 membrane protein [Leucobacter sp. UCD-THU]
MIDLLSTLVTITPGEVNISPNDNGLPGIEALKKIVGATMTIALILSVMALLVSAVIWGFGANSANPHMAARGKLGVLISCAAALLSGAAVALINFAWGIGQTI